MIAKFLKGEIVELAGKLNGPTSIILAGVHGDEICGVEAIKNLLPTLKVEKGRVLIVLGNPRAYKKNKRFSQANLNRMFNEARLISRKEKKSYEYKRAQFLKKYLNQASALLDVHASFTPKSRTFVIAEKNAGEVLKYLPFDLVVSGFDKIQPGGTDYYMNRQGKIGICVECGFLGEKKSISVAEKSITSFLKERGHIRGALKGRKQKNINIYTMYKTKTDKFRLLKPFDDFAPVKKGAVIGIDGKRKIRAAKNSLVLFARDRDKIGEEAFLLAELK